MSTQPKPSNPLKAVRGTRDLLPPETALWNRIEQTAREVFARYGFGEIRTPIFEATELFRSESSARHARSSAARNRPLEPHRADRARGLRPLRIRRDPHPHLRSHRTLQIGKQCAARAIFCRPKPPSGTASSRPRARSSPATDSARSAPPSSKPPNSSDRKAVRGTRDLLPPETALWNRIEQTAREVFARYGFGEIRTPIFEATELFARGVGEETDIVSKEMYTWEDGER